MNKVKQYDEQRTAYYFIAIPMILFFTFMVVPFFLTFVFSLTDYSGLAGTEFIGVENYKRLANDAFFWNSLGNTIKYVVMFVPAVTFFSLMAAMLVNNEYKATAVFRTAIYIPVLSSTVAVATIWLWLYNGEYGLINNFLGIFGFEGQPWINQTSTAMGAIVVMTVWSSIGTNMLIFLAALKNVPDSIYEAADIDGAGAVKKFIKLTVPSIKPTIFFITMTTTIGAFQMFDQAYMLTDGAYNTNTIMLYIYDSAFGNLDMGYGSAMAVFVFIIVFIISFINYKYNGGEE